MKNPYISGTGSYLPVQVVTNEELSQRIDTSHDWIFSRTGIKERRIASSEETSGKMGAEAAKRAMAAANVKPEQINMIIVATCTPDFMFPSTACVIQRELGIPAVPAFDIQAACSGFIYGIDIAYQYLLNNSNAEHILIIGTEVMSRTVDWSDRSTCVLFGDGAGAAVLSKRAEPGVLWSKLGADGKYGNLLSLNNFMYQEDKTQSLFLKMSGGDVYKVAVKTLENLVHQALEENGLSEGEVNWLIPHQANIRIIQAVAKRLGVSMEHVVQTVAEHANTSAASIPLALDQAVRDGRVQRGNLLLMEAFGAGFTWGAMLVRY